MKTKTVTVNALVALLVLAGWLITPTPVSAVGPSRPVTVSADGLFTLSVRTQPTGSPQYVSRSNEDVTLFGLAAQFGTTGLLAHEDLAGGRFAQLTPGTHLSLTYSDGSARHYKVTAHRRFRAARPADPFSTFIDLDSGRELSAETLFREVYMTTGGLVLQTCIAREGSPAWGRLFVVAERVAQNSQVPPVFHRWSPVEAR